MSQKVATRQIEDIVRRYTPLDIDDCSTGRFLLMAAFQGVLRDNTFTENKVWATGQRELSDDELELLGNRIDYQLRSDEKASRLGLENFLYNILTDEMLEKGLDTDAYKLVKDLYDGGVLDEDIFSKGEFLRYLRDHANTDMGISIDPRTRRRLDTILETYEEELENTPTIMSFVLGEQYLEGIDYVSIREKTFESLALKILSRYNKIFGLTNTQAKEFISEGGFYATDESGNLVNNRKLQELKKTFTADRLAYFTLEHFLPKFMAGGIDYFEHMSGMVPIEYDYHTKLKGDDNSYTVSITFNPDFEEYVGNFFLFDGAGVRICPSRGSMLDSMMKTITNETALRRQLNSRFGHLLEIVPGGVENFYGTSIKDGSAVIKTTGPRRGNYNEFRIHTAIDMIKAECEEGRAHIEYKQKVARKVRDGIRRSKLMKVAAYNICRVLDVDLEDIVPGIKMSRLEKEITKVY